jgi:hypothetical protein
MLILHSFNRNVITYQTTKARSYEASALKIEAIDPYRMLISTRLHRIT